jgi:hypothetical protein
MTHENKAVLINTGRFGPELGTDMPRLSDASDIVSGGIRLISCRETEIDTKKLLPGISTRLVDRQSLQAGIAAKQTLNVLPEGSGMDKAGVILGSSFGATASMYDFFHKIATDGPVSISPMEFPNTVSNAAASRVGMWFSLKGHCVSISNGNLSGLDALGLAEREIRHQVMDYYLVGGSEEVPEVVRRIYAKVTEADRESDRSNGIAREILYEGAAMLLLTSVKVTMERQLNPICYFDGYEAGTVLRGAKSPGQVVNEIEKFMERCGYRADEVLFCTGITPGSGLSYAVIAETITRFGHNRVLVHNCHGDTVVNYFAAEGIMGIIAAVEALRAPDNQNRRQAVVFNVENDGRFSAVAIHV